MEMRTLEQIEQEIAETKAALNDVHGTETEVYAPAITRLLKSLRKQRKPRRNQTQTTWFVPNGKPCQSNSCGRCVPR